MVALATTLVALVDMLERDHLVELEVLPDLRLPLAKTVDLPPAAAVAVVGMAAKEPGETVA